MSELKRFQHEIRSAHAGEPWHGSSLKQILAEIDARAAAARPIPEAHSIWELVLHLTGWTREVTRRLKTGKRAVPDEGDWPAVPAQTAQAWAAAKQALHEAHEELIKTIETFPEPRLHQPIEKGKPTTYAQTLAGLTQHDAYHGGQISLLHKATKARAVVL
jgi:uncharacterized damage-inducible protein DinB